MNIENLNNKQQEAVLKTEGPLLVLAEQEVVKLRF